MGQKEKKEIYNTCKELGLDVKWTMSEAALRDALDDYNKDQEKKAFGEQQKMENDARELAEQKAADEEAKAIADAEASAKEEEEDEEEDLDEDDDYDEDEEVNVVFENGDDGEEPVVAPVAPPTPKAKPKPPIQKKILEARYFPKKKAVSEDPYEIYKNQMNRTRRKKK